MLALETEDGVIALIIGAIVSPLIYYITKRQEVRLQNIEKVLKTLRPAESTMSKVETIMENARLTSIEIKLQNIEKLLKELVEGKKD